MNDKIKYLFKNVGILTISGFASKILNFFLVPLYTSKLSTVDFGTFDFIVTSVTLLIPILTLGMSDALLIFLLDKSKNRVSVTNIVIRFCINSIPFFAIILIFISNLNVFSYSPFYYVFALGSYFFSIFNQFFVQYSKGIENVKVIGVAGVLSTVASLTFNILFLVVLNMGITGYLWASILTQLSSFIFYFCSLKIWEVVDLHIKDVYLQKEMLRFSIPLVLGTLSWFINYASDKYVVTFMCGLAANGILSIAYTIPQIVTSMDGFFIQAWQISAMKEFNEADETYRFYGNMFVYFNFCLCVVCSWLIILSRPVASIIYQNEFYEAWQYAPFLMFSSLMNANAGFIGPILSAKKNSKILTLSTIIPAVFNIILDVILAYFWGIQGATIATAISSCMIFEIRKLAVKKELIIKRYWRVIVTWIGLLLQGVLEIFEISYFLEAIVMIILLMINIDILKDATRSLANIFFRRKEVN